MKSGPNLFFAVVAFVFLLTCSLTFAEKPAPSFDLIITNGHIIDGTGSPWYSGDIGISNGKITAIGNLSETARKHTIDAREMIVAPGFIDMLGQSETTILVDPRLPSKIYQGITTEITGEGGSAAPLNDSIIQNDRPSYAHYHVTPDWRTLRQYFARLEKQGMGINLASYVGATQVRRMVLGDDDKQPTPEQLEQMKQLVREAMRAGAVGVSTSLEYAPAPYAKTEEIIALASEAAKFGGIYATHMRNESDAVLTAIDEALRIGGEAHIPVEIWHIKVAGKENWGRMPEVVAKINAARAQGMDITADTYAYTAWFNSVSVFGMSEPDVVLALQQPWVAIDNDSSGASPEGILGQEHPHPRAYGTFPRILRKYVREEKKLALEDAIRKFSALPAQRMRITDRGVLKEGMWADVVIFDPTTVRDLATSETPNQLSEGMQYVLVNGVPVIDEGKMTGVLPGKVLRGPGYALKSGQ